MSKTYNHSSRLMFFYKELSLQKEIDSESSAPSAYGTLNRALHSIAAHLQRYGSELVSMEDVLSDIVEHHQTFSRTRIPPNKDTQRESVVVCEALNEVSSHLKQVRAFLQELKAKLENILALVSCTSLNMLLFSPRDNMEVEACIGLISVALQLYSNCERPTDVFKRREDACNPSSDSGRCQNFQGHC